MTTPDQLLTVEQAAIRLHVHPITVRRHLRSGLLRGIKRGRLWRVPESALIENTLTENTQPVVSPLARALAMIEERDALAGQVPIRHDGSAVEDLRSVREAQTP